MQIADKYMKRGSTLLIIRETQIKTTKMAIKKKAQNISVGKDVENRTLYTLGENGKWLSCYGKQNGNSSKN